MQWSNGMIICCFSLKKHCDNFDSIMDSTIQMPKIYVNIELLDDTKNNILLLRLHIYALFLHIPLRLWYHQTSQSPFHIYQVQYKFINILYGTKLQPNLKCSLHVKVHDTKSTMKWYQFSGKIKACTKCTLFWGCC